MKLSLKPKPGNTLASRRYANAVGPTSISLTLLADDCYELRLKAFGTEFVDRHSSLRMVFAMMNHRITKHEKKHRIGVFAWGDDG